MYTYTYMHVCIQVVEKVLPATPVVGVVSTCLLVASAVAQCAPAIRSAGLALQLPGNSPSLPLPLLYINKKY